MVIQTPEMQTTTLCEDQLQAVSEVEENYDSIDYPPATDKYGVSYSTPST